MSKRVPVIVGLTALGGAGYYLYGAGGSPKAAETQFESDVHKASANVKSHLPGTSPNAEASAKAYGKEAGAKIDKVWGEADRKAGVAKSNVEAYAKETKADALKAVNKFDKEVEDGAAKTKSGLSSWFSSGNK